MVTLRIWSNLCRCRPRCIHFYSFRYKAVKFTVHNTNPAILKPPLFPQRYWIMNHELLRRQSTGHGQFGVFSVDRFGTVGDLVGMWYHTLAQAERYLKRVKGQSSQNYTALSRAEHDKRIAEQQAAGLAFKTGHDLLMAEFDEWLKDNHLVRAAEAATRLELSDKEFKSVIKRGLIKRKSMPNHDNLIGFPAD